MAAVSCTMAAAANVQRLRTFSFSDAIPQNFAYSFLPSNNDEVTWPAVDAYSFDEFRMYEFKVRRCTRGRSHDWTECPFAHPGEKARRRDPRKFHYSGMGCPDLRKGSCRRGDACEFAHGVFECWLHPARYRTQPCKDGRSCQRRVCFFAHTPNQLRLLPGMSHNFSPRVVDSCSGCSYDDYPLRFSVGGEFCDPSVYNLRNPGKEVNVGKIVKSVQKMDLHRGPQQRKSSVSDENGRGSSRLQSTEWRDTLSYRLGKEVSGVEEGNECPDLSWVNELVM